MDNQFARVQIQGMVAGMPVVRYQTSGIPVASLTVSVKRERKNKSHTIDYLDVVVIGDEDEAHAENAVAVEKGQFVSIEGQLVMRIEKVTRGKEVVQKQRMVVKALLITHAECAAR